jgi:hypothetical protein
VRYRLDSAGLGHGPVAVSCEDSNESSSFITRLEIYLTSQTTISFSKDCNPSGFLGLIKDGNFLTA